MIFGRTRRPALTFTSPSGRDSFDLPDYYRSTRLETYGPYYRSPPPVVDLMKTIDLRGQDIGFESGSFLPDIFEEEEDEITLDEEELKMNDKVEFLQDDVEVEDEIKQKQASHFLRRMLSVLRKIRGIKVHTGKKGRMKRPRNLSLNCNSENVVFEFWVVFLALLVLSRHQHCWPRHF